MWCFGIVALACAACATGPPSASDDPAPAPASSEQEADAGVEPMRADARSLGDGSGTDGSTFQSELLADGEVTAEEYQAALRAAVECIRDEGFAVTFPDPNQRVVVDVAIDPDELLSFSVLVPEGSDPSDLVRRCQREWSTQVELAWQEQLTPPDDQRDRMVQAALACGRERGLQRTGSDETDAFLAVAELDCRPWEQISHDR